MITDPDERGYRYPQPGERLWHQPARQWCTVLPPEMSPRHGDLEVIAEVPVALGPEHVCAVVKLRSLADPDGGTRDA